MAKAPIEFDVYASVDLRVGRVTQVLPFERARNPSYKVAVDLDDLGEKWSSAQLTSYSREQLIGKLVSLGT